jgi:hypothetical protein
MSNWIEKCKAYQSKNGCSYKEAMTALSTGKTKKRAPKKTATDNWQATCSIKKSKNRKIFLGRTRWRLLRINCDYCFRFSSG